ncbi:MAG: sigma-70 family RNA polymerase sigma factor [Planctomycetes bacterium]|nr:sigma-70 family RNA polymerase sigma factor [Planctomycetota bacterium]
MSKLPETRQATQLLHRLADGDASASNELLALLYDELHGLARSCMAQERRQHTLQATALVNEAWLRLQGDLATPRNRAHFLGAAAQAMRRVLIDHARRRDAEKRGGALERRPYEDLLELFEERGGPLLELEEALAKLGELDPELVRVIEMRFFAGATTAEIAEALDMSTRSVERAWATAQAWLKDELDPRP